MRAKTISIFRRCRECKKLYLEDENHVCSSSFEGEIDVCGESATILERYREPMDQKEICRILNKMAGRLRFTQFFVGYVLRHNESFEEIQKNVFALKSWRTVA